MRNVHIADVAVGRQNFVDCERVDASETRAGIVPASEGGQSKFSAGSDYELEGFICLAEIVTSSEDGMAGEAEMDRCIQSQRGERMETHLARRTEVGGSSIACKSVCLYGIFHLRSQADEPLGGGKRRGLPVAANRKGKD